MSFVSIVTSESRDRPDLRRRGAKRMFYGDYSYELAKERMGTAIRDHERNNLVKQFRLATKDPSSGFVTRSAALIMSLFR